MIWSNEDLDKILKEVEVLAASWRERAKRPECDHIEEAADDVEYWTSTVRKKAGIKP